MEMNHLEIDFLFSIGFELNVTPAIFSSYCSILQRELYLQSPPPPPPSTNLHCCLTEDESSSRQQKQGAVQLIFFGTQCSFNQSVAITFVLYPSSLWQWRVQNLVPCCQSMNTSFSSPAEFRSELLLHGHRQVHGWHDLKQMEPWPLGACYIVSTTTARVIAVRHWDLDMLWSILFSEAICRLTSC